MDFSKVLLLAAAGTGLSALSSLRSSTWLPGTIPMVLSIFSKLVLPAFFLMAYRGPSSLSIPRGLRPVTLTAAIANTAEALSQVYSWGRTQVIFWNSPGAASTTADHPFRWIWGEVLEPAFWILGSVSLVLFLVAMCTTPEAVTSPTSSIIEARGGRSAALGYAALAAALGVGFRTSLYLTGILVEPLIGGPVPRSAWNQVQNGISAAAGASLMIVFLILYRRQSEHFLRAD